MARRVALGLLLLVALMVGLTLEPDSGTAASVGTPDVVGDIVGANHAKPLPRVPRVEDVVVISIAAVLIVLVLTPTLGISAPRPTGDDDHRRSLLWARVRARRGPPAPPAG